MAFDGNSLGIEALDKALANVSELNAGDGSIDNAVVTTVGNDACTYGPKKRNPSPMKAMNHNFYTVDGDIIVDYNFTHLNIDQTPASDLFRVSQPIVIAMCQMLTNDI